MFESPPDSLIRFLFEHFPVRGEHITLDGTWESVLARSDYPPAVLRLLGEALAAVALLAGGVKLRGSVTVQVQGDGPVSLLVVQCSSNGEMRGMARCREVPPEHAGVSELLGAGRLVITLDPEGQRRYQGIVPLEGDSLAAVFERYFAQSEQLETRFWLCADEERVAGLMLQQLPGASPDTAEHWERVNLIADTLTGEELRELPAGELVRRLYHEEDVRVFKPRPVGFHCPCNRKRIEDVIRSLGRERLAECREEDGSVYVDCEFCNQRYRFDRVDLERLFRHRAATPGTTTRH